MGPLRVTIGHLRITVGHFRVTISHLRATMGHLRLTSIGYLIKPLQCADRGQFTKKSKKPTQRRPPFSIITNLKPT